MTYAEAIELLIDGTITHEFGDVLRYGQSRKFFIDKRTKSKLEPEHDVVFPLGKTVCNYWLYVCPDCGMVHAVHRDMLRKDKAIICGCRNSRFKRYIIGCRQRLPAKKIILDIWNTETMGDSYE